MENTLERIDHNLHTPEFYDRDYENDFPAQGITFPLQFGVFNQVNIKRIALLALPFITRYSAPGKVFSLTMNGIRTVTNISNVHAAAALSYEQFVSLFQLTLAVISIAGTITSFKLGMMITSAADILQNIKASISHCNEGEYGEAFKDVLHVISSLLYASMIYGGSIEITLICLAVKGCIHLYESKDEYNSGHYPEAVAKFALGMMKFKDAHTQFTFLQRRNFLNSLAKFQGLLEKIHKSRKIDHLYDHPLACMESSIEDGKVVFYDDEGNSYDFGAHFAEYGGGLVKGMNITFRTTEEYTEMEFKVNHVFRAKIQESIAGLTKLQRDPKELKEFLTLNKVDIKHLKLTTTGIESDSPFWDNYKAVHKVDVGGRGMVEIGADPEFISSFDKVKITLPKGKSIYDLNSVLSMLGLEEALRESSKDDLERMKLGHLFHTLSPAEAFKLERSPDFFDLSIADLKSRIIESDPSMEKKIDTYLDKMRLEDILPGRKRLHIEGLTSELQKQFGDFHLTAMLMGSGSKEDSFKRFSSIMQIGLLSKEMKDNAKMGNKGLVGDGDYYGSTDSTFVQMVTNQSNYNELLYSWWGGGYSIRLIIDPKILESGTYQYHDDLCGNRMTEDSRWSQWGDNSNNYMTRDGIEDFTEREMQAPGYANEVMIKDSIDPKYITGIAIENEEMKADLLDYLAALGHYKDGKIFGRDAENFIQIGQDVKSTEAAQ